MKHVQGRGVHPQRRNKPEPAGIAAAVVIGDGSLLLGPSPLFGTEAAIPAVILLLRKMICQRLERKDVKGAMPDAELALHPGAFVMTRPRRRRSLPRTRTQTPLAA